MSAIMGSDRLRVTTIAAAALLAASLTMLMVWGTKPAEAAFPGKNGKIAFVSDRLTAGNPIPPGQTRPDAEIFTMNPNGTGVQQATFNTAHDWDLNWSPNGKKITFSSNLGNPAGDYEIYIMDPNGAQQQRLTIDASLSDFDPVLSPDGTKIAFAKNNFDIYVMDSDPNTNDTPKRLAANPAFDTGPAWSPNGNKIAFESNRDGDYEIYVMDSNPNTNDTPINITNTRKNTADFNPNWSPSGEKIAFDRVVGKGDSEIYTMKKNGRQQKMLTDNGNAVYDEDPAWSPNGNKIAFQRIRGGDSEIYVMNPDGSKQKNRTNNNANDFAPDWQPVP